MEVLEFLRQFTIGGYAVFDFVVSFLGIYLLSSRLSRWFAQIGVIVPRNNWLYLVLPFSIIVHLMVGSITPMTRDFIDMNDNFILKVAIFYLLILGLRNVKFRDKNLLDVILRK